MLQNGVDVKAVQEVLGHEHLNTTEIYTHIDNEALRVAAKANPLSHVKMKGKIEDKTPRRSKLRLGAFYACICSPVCAAPGTAWKLVAVRAAASPRRSCAPPIRITGRTRRCRHWRCTTTGECWNDVTLKAQLDHVARLARGDRLRRHRAATGPGERSGRTRKFRRYTTPVHAGCLVVRRLM